MNTNWRVGLVNQTGELRMPTAPMRSPFFMTWATVNVVVGSTGDKTITIKVLGQTCTFTTTFATTGSYTLAFGIVIRNVGNTRSVIVFPPTYITKSAGTTPTNGILASTQSVVVTVDIGGNIGVYVLPSPPVHGGSTPGCINWLVASARDANLSSGAGPGSSNYHLVDPFVGPTAATEYKDTRDADPSITTSPATKIIWATPNGGTPVPETTFYNPSGSIVVDGTLGVVTYGTGSMYRLITTPPHITWIPIHVNNLSEGDAGWGIWGRPVSDSPGFVWVPQYTTGDQLADAYVYSTRPPHSGTQGGGPQSLPGTENMLGD